MIYSVDDDDDEKTKRKNSFDDGELKVLYDCQVKTTEIRLNLLDGLLDEIDEGKIFLRGESHLLLSIQFHEDEQRFSPFASSIDRHVDSTTLTSFHWTIELLREKNDSASPRLSLHDDDDSQHRCDYSFASSDASLVRLSLDEVHPWRKQFSWLTDLPFDRYAVDLLSWSLFPADAEPAAQTDLVDEHFAFADPIDNYQKVNEREEIRFDVEKDKADGPGQIGSAPCLRRKDFPRPPPPTWSRLRREIGFVSYNGAEENPHYKLDKSNKRFVHLPKERKNLSLNIYDGYEQFIDKVQKNPTNYFRSFDYLALRPLLFWFVHKQHLFASSTSTTEKSPLLPPPKIFCRRLTLTKILANLYSDSEAWKLLVLRHKGQFYLSLATERRNNSTR